MIREAADFPHPGSWALFEHAGKTLPVRIQLRRGDSAVISIPSYYGIASGNRTVPLADLQDPTPLTDAEQSELGALEKKLLGSSRRRKADVERFEALGQREHRARVLKDLLAKLPAKYVPEAAAAYGRAA